MLKAQDIVLLVKLLAKPEHLNWPQNKLALHLCYSVSAVNPGIKRLKQSNLLRSRLEGNLYQPVLAACEEFLISAVKYIYPGELGGYTRGIPTCYAAPVFGGEIMEGNDGIPVWPHEEGKQRGLALKPLYHNIPKSITEFPDQAFYDLLALIDALRFGRARERNMAEKILGGKLHANKKK